MDESRAEKSGGIARETNLFARAFSVDYTAFRVERNGENAKTFLSFETKVEICLTRGLGFVKIKQSAKNRREFRDVGRRENAEFGSVLWNKEQN